MASIEQHPPERRAKRGIIVACPGSCCCCCCCLHTLGGIIGAAIASRATAGKPPATAPDHAAELVRQQSSIKASGCYWQLLAALCGVIVLVFGVPGGPGSAFVAILCIAIFLPALQLLVCVAAGILIRLNWPRQFPDRGAALKRVGAITAAAFAGAVIGTGIMVLLGLVFGARS
jgi:hypothetical protein